MTDAGVTLKSQQNQQFIRLVSCKTVRISTDRSIHEQQNKVKKQIAHCPDTFFFQ